MADAVLVLTCQADMQNGESSLVPAQAWTCGVSVGARLHYHRFLVSSDSSFVFTIVELESLTTVPPDTQAEYRNLVEDFVALCHRNNLLLNTFKTKELVVDFRRVRPLTQPVSIEGVQVEMVKTYRYLELHLDERLDWSANTDILYRKGQSRLYFLRRLGSFNICRKLLQMFYQTVVSSCLLYAVVCWGGSIKKRDEMRLDKLVSTQVLLLLQLQKRLEPSMGAKSMAFC
ncbi:hypothetical protein NFI96_000288 [Prochilodus magdalenae]|nr:hypothetical protein NFI96_000288 [Prochilodus magdalenae]